MRDAIVAGINLNIFNKHCDRVKMANIAQMVNVLKSVILTEGEKMVLTPTYHVFHMYKYHQDAELLESSIDTEEIGVDEENKVPNLNESVSMAEDGTVNITLTNLSATESYPDFAHDSDVVEKAFTDIANENGVLKFTIPACAVMPIAVK